MAEHKPEKHTPPDPNLVRPRNESIVDGHNVTFEWEPVPGAAEYRIQVATQGAFDTIIFDEMIAGETAVQVDDRFSDDGETLFWRVMTRTEEGAWSAGDTVESFIGSTPEQAALQLARPDDDEHHGPFSELVRSSAIEVGAEVTGREDYYAKEVEQGVQHEGVETGQIMGIAATVFLAIILLIITAFLLVDNLEQTVRYQITGMSGYPELQRTEELALEKLTTYGIVDEEAGVFQIPIERAMQLTVQAYGGEAVDLMPEAPVPSDTSAAELPGAPANPSE